MSALAFSPNGKVLASGSADKKIILWDTHSWEKIKTLEGHSGSVLGIAFSPDGSQLVSGSGDETILLWDASSWRVLKIDEGALRACFSSNDKLIEVVYKTETVHYDTHTLGEVSREYCTASEEEQHEHDRFSKNGNMHVSIH